MPDEEWIAFVTEYVDSHYEEKLTLEVLALLSHGTLITCTELLKNQGHDPSGLHPTCSNREGENVIDYFDDPVSQVGESVGLSNTPYFITLFKKKTGQTPEAYRRQQNNT